MRLIHIMVLGSMLLTGCAFSPQKANLQPTVNITQGTEGQGVAVAVRVVDERPSKSLGRRGTAYGAAAEITAGSDLEAIVRDKVAAALVARGFAVNAAGVASDAKLAVEIRLLEYSTSQGFWTGGVQIQGTLKAAASKAGSDYEQIYRSNKEERVAVVPTAKTNEEWINAALSDVLNQLVSDQALITFLAK